MKFRWLVFAFCPKAGQNAPLSGRACTFAHDKYFLRGLHTTSERYHRVVCKCFYTDSASILEIGRCPSSLRVGRKNRSVPSSSLFLLINFFIRCGQFPPSCLLFGQRSAHFLFASSAICPHLSAVLSSVFHVLGPNATEALRTYEYTAEQFNQ